MVTFSSEGFEVQLVRVIPLEERAKTEALFILFMARCFTILGTITIDFRKCDFLNVCSM